MVKIFFDVETTGTNHMKHSIIQLGGLVEVDGKVVEEFDYKVKPHPKAIIEEAAMAINGKSIEEVMTYPDMKTVHGQFTELLNKYVDKYEKADKIWLIGFNNRAFDDFFLRTFFELCGDKYIGSYFWVDTLDVLCLASQYLLDRRSSMPPFKLKRVALELGIEVNKAELHDASFDVKLTRQIYRIVTGLEQEPAQAFEFYYNPKSKKIWKVVESAEVNSNDLRYKITFQEYKVLLKQMRLLDGPELIQDDLF